ncbi:MAG: PfkB family carbohydrate kinase [Planctomycetota bacterium]|jgi:hypothetical protein
MTLLVTGTIGIDTVLTPTATADKALGGSCAYFAAAASLFGPVRVVAAVGGDWPDAHRAILEGFDNICLKGLERRPDSRTFAWGGRYLGNMNERETLFTELGVLEEDPPAVPPAYRDTEFVFVANTHPSVQAGLLSHFPDRKLAVADTMNLWIATAHAELMEVLGQVDGLVLNDSEAIQLTEIANAVSAARRILDFGPSFVVVKKGEHGAVLVHRDGVATVPGLPRGAGPDHRSDGGGRQLRRRHDGTHRLRGDDGLCDHPDGAGLGDGDGQLHARVVQPRPARRDRPRGHR